VEQLPAGTGPGDYITSLEVTAGKARSAVEYTPAVNELVAMGAAVASNCEPCLKYHYREADQLGVSKADMARAIETGGRVKDSPHQAILRLADKLTGSSLGEAADGSDRCCGSRDEEVAAGGSKCCG
jgi:AhpD family alkylhydroperoxidase